MVSSFAPRAASPSPALPPSGHTAGVKQWRRPVAALLASAILFAAGAAVAQSGPAPAKASPAAAKEPESKTSAAKGRAALVLLGSEKAAQDADKAGLTEGRILRGVVAIERGGQAIALGGVLAGDGRILTALSPLGHGNDLVARFADGSVVKVKLGHHDRIWDLALLVPQAGRWKDGLVASSKDPVRQDATIRSFATSKGKVAPAPLLLRSHTTLLGGDDRALDNAIELGSRVSPAELGSPIVDEAGSVVGVLVRGCAPVDKGPCTPVAFGAPIAPIKRFLRDAPPTAAVPAAWLGIQGVAETTANAKGVRVVGVRSDSPAAEAHIRAGDPAVSDTILAVDGTPVTTPESLADVVRAHAVGEKVPLTLLGQGRYRQVFVTFRAPPDPPAATPTSSAHPAELPTPGSGAAKR